MAQEIIQTVDVNLGNSIQNVQQLGTAFKEVGVNAETSDKSVVELTKDVKNLTGEINNLSQAERNGQVGKVLSEELKAAQIELKGAIAETKSLTEATEAASQTAVKSGNIFTKAFSSLRSLSYVLPGIGVAGILGAIAEGAVLLFQSLTSGSNEATIALKAFNDTVSASGAEVGKTVVEVQKMTTIFDEAKQGVVSKDTALIEYNKHFGATLGTAKDYNTAEELFVSKSAAYIQAMQQRAIADAAYDLEKKAISKSISDAANLETTTFQQIKAGVIGLFTNISNVGTKLSEYNRDNIKENKDLAETYHNIATKAQEAGDAIAKAAGINLYGNDDKKKGKEDNSLDEQARYLAESKKILEDAQAKEITTENIKYQKIYDDLVEHHHSTEALEAQHQQNLLDIHTKYALKAEEEEVKAFDKAQLNKAKRDAKALADDQKALADFQKAKNDYFTKSENIGVNQEQREINNENAKYEKLKQLAIENGQSLEAIEQQHQDNLLAIQQSATNRTIASIDRLTQRDNKNVFAQLKVKQDNLKAAQATIDDLVKKGSITEQKAHEERSSINAADKELQKEKRDAYANTASDVGDSLTTIGQALGEHTQAGKDFEIAGATISAISSAVKSYDSLASIPYVGPALGAIAAAAALAAGYANVQKIEDVDVPGQGGGSGSSASSVLAGTSYTAPVIPQATVNTNLSSQSIQQIKQANDKPIRAYVLESEITDSQQTVSSYRNASRIGR